MPITNHKSNKTTSYHTPLLAVASPLTTLNNGPLTERFDNLAGRFLSRHRNAGWWCQPPLHYHRFRWPSLRQNSGIIPNSMLRSRYVLDISLLFVPIAAIIQSRTDLSFRIFLSSTPRDTGGLKWLFLSVPFRLLVPFKVYGWQVTAKCWFY